MDKPVANMAGEPVQKMHELDHIPDVGNMVLVPANAVDQLERYEQFVDGWGDEVLGLKQHPKGDYVKFEDVLALLSAAPQPSLEGEVGEAVKNLRSDAAQLLRMSETASFGHDLSVRVSDPSLLILSMTTAAAILQSLSADNARLRADLSEAVEVLKPFAEASANLDDSHPNGSPIWESPAAMGIDAKHLRAAQSFLDTQGGGNG
ncbi:hypothetical protein JP75_25215 [Devosia riboflavina]|uniref:Uncharacterized protein n=1 Tax=Devosia riboflavina TaxID=46914 RepID=A0A087LSM7_9HYPH|nr:hypothetical protein [Devosia riboflavina]KFL27630.1 hypothetical protein JP75_25215 [Devosia riboflavina]